MSNTTDALNATQTLDQTKDNEHVDRDEGDEAGTELSSVDESVSDAENENDPGVVQDMLGGVLQDLMLSGQTPSNAANPRYVELCEAFMTLAKHVCGEARIADADAPALLNAIYKSDGDADRFPKRRRVNT